MDRIEVRYLLIIPNARDQFLSTEHGGRQVDFLGLIEQHGWRVAHKEPIYAKSEVAQEFAIDERLAMLVDREAVERDNAALAQRLRLARLRQAACLEDIDYRTPRGLDRSLINTLAGGRWLREHNNILILGPTGTGKSFVACALGNQAARDGFSVRYQRLSRLLDELALARVEGKAARLLAQLARIQLLVLDDWAMARLTAEQRRDLMEVVDDRHQRASTILATQIPVERWHDSIGDPTYADAILDRLVHNAYRIELRGDSMRRRQPDPPGDEKN